MQAIFKSGGKQYLAKQDEIIKIEKVDAEPGEDITFEEIVLVTNKDKSNITDLSKSCVKARVISQTRDKKLIIFKKRRRKNSRRKNGHRQYVSFIKITEIIA